MPTLEFVKKWFERGVVSVEMERITLFVSGLMWRMKTGVLLAMSDSLIHEAEKRPRTEEEIGESIYKAAEAVLKAIAKVPAYVRAIATHLS